MAYTSLYDLFNIELKQMGLPENFNEISKFINDDKKSLDFIRYLIKDIGFDSTQELAQSRARHCVINYLLGRVFKGFGNLYNRFISNSNDSKANDKLWMYTSLYHDYGYFSKYITDASVQIEDIVTYNVLKYNYDGNLAVLNYFESRFPYFIQNTYEDIMHYFEYSRDYHKKNKYDSEKVDHGILGGTLVFDRIIKKSKGSKLDLPQLKMACITICQHNIFKSQNASADNLYIKHNLEYLCHDQNYFITERTPLLLFLSLIDTIECVKKFNKGIADKYFQTKTILQMIKVEISEKSLSIDFSELKRNSKKKGKNFYNKTYVKYWDVINTISQWTQFDTANYEDKLTITMKPLQIVTFDEYEIV